MSHIERLKYQVLDLVPEKYTRLQKKTAKLFEELTEVSKDNVKAIIDSRNIDLHTLELGLDTLLIGEDYELSGSYRVELPDEDDLDDYSEEHVTGEQREQAMEKLQETIDDLNDAETRGPLNPEQEKELAWAQKASDAYALAEWEEDEVMWNYGWRPYNENIDEAIAAKCGLTVVKFLQGVHEDESYITLPGCGMDLTAKIIAYIALAHEGVDHDHVDYFVRDIDARTVHVMGETLFKEVCQKLNILGAVTKLRKAQKREYDKRRRDDDRRRAKNDKIANKPPSPKLRKILEDALADYIAHPPADGDTSWLEIDRVWDALHVPVLKREKGNVGKKILNEIYAYRKAINWHLSVQQVLAIGQPKPVETT